VGAAALLSSMDEPSARAALTRCCGASRWVEAMLARRPFPSDEALLREADDAWAAASREDVLEAFAHHPRIGANLDELRARYASTSAWSSGEQRGVQAASEATLLALREGNLAYEARFGHIFIVCATGKGADEMLALLRARLPNDPATELGVAAAEQGKITRIRLAKLVSEER
jgi:2-oxo-4-hydroxy-4-carboxy-5-ureidoimidazoline decarboxylase